MPDGLGDQAVSWVVRSGAWVLADPMVRLAQVMLWLFVLAISVFILCVLIHVNFASKKQQGKKATERKHIHTSRIESLLEWMFPSSDPWTVGHVIVDFKWLAHCLVWGTTGSGKSTFVMLRILRPYVGLPGLVLICLRLILHWIAPLVAMLTGIEHIDTLIPVRQRRGALVYAGNYSAPFRAAVLWLREHGYPALIWEPDPTPGSGFGLNVLEGPPDNVGQRLIKMQPVSTNNTGLRSGAIEGMLVDSIYTIDREKQPRNFANILATIRVVGVRDLDDEGKPVGDPRELTRNEKAGLEDWCTRFGTLRRRLGACIGDDVKLSEVLDQGYVVFVQGSSYNNPNSIDEITNLFVFYVMWLVGSVKNFDFIIDEPGAVEKGTFTRLLTATRAQGVRIMICPQSIEQVDKKLREMCTTVLILGVAAASHESQDLASDMVHGDIEPVDFALLTPTDWKQKAVFWRPRRGLRSCTGYLLNNGRLDRVKTAYAGCKNDTAKLKPGQKRRHARGCKLAIIDLYPSGSIPKMPWHPTGDEQVGKDSTAPTTWGISSPESASTVVAQSAVHSHLDDDSVDAVSVDESEDVAAVETLSGVSVGSFCPEIAMQSSDGRRIWSKGKTEVCLTLDHLSVNLDDKTIEALGKPHRIWQGSGNGTTSDRPKDQVKALFGPSAGIRTTVTVYNWWWQLLSGKPLSATKPDLDHLCHTYDDSCPGVGHVCEIPDCDDPAHPVGFQCQHVKCYEVSHLEPVSKSGLQGNAQRRSDQKARHETWLSKQKVAA